MLEELADLKEGRNDDTMKLVVGDWICIDSSDNIEPIWLGRVMSNPDWGGQGVFKNETTRTKKYDNGTELTRGDIGVYIMWYEKIDVNSESHDYHVSRTITKPSTQNNLYVVCSGFQMHRTVGCKNPLPRRRKIVEETTRETTMIGTIKNMALFGKWIPSFARRL